MQTMRLQSPGRTERPAPRGLDRSFSEQRISAHRVNGIRPLTGLIEMALARIVHNTVPLCMFLRLARRALMKSARHRVGKTPAVIVSAGNGLVIAYAD
jgi:hypothetical protein